MGLIVDVYRAASCARYGTDSTLGGISARYDRLCLVNVDGPFSPTDEAGPAMLVKHTPFGDHEGRRLAKIVPVLQQEDGLYLADPRQTVFGGNFAASSDSRFRRMVERITGQFFSNAAIPVFDRIED